MPFIAKFPGGDTEWAYILMMKLLFILLLMAVVFYNLSLADISNFHIFLVVLVTYISYEYKGISFRDML